MKISILVIVFLMFINTSSFSGEEGNLPPRRFVWI